MTATVREFCRKYGIDEKSEELVNEIYEALCGKVVRPCDKGQEGKSILEMSGATVPDMSEDWAASQHALYGENLS